MPTKNREDYLRALYLLTEKEPEIKSVDIAKYLHISKPSVSEMVQELDKEGLIIYQRYAKLQFTPKGKKIAEKLTAKHRLIELFLKNILKMDAHQLHEEAHRLEHAFSDEAIEKIRALLGNPTTDPHGKPIPR